MYLVVVQMTRRDREETIKRCYEIRANAPSMAKVMALQEAKTERGKDYHRLRVTSCQRGQLFTKGQDYGQATIR